MSKQIQDDFATWIRKRHLAPSHRIPHLVRWVESFLRLARVRNDANWNDTLLVFLQDLGEGRTADWQIRQAADAVSLYCGQFRRLDTTQSDSAKSPKSKPQTPDKLLAEMEQLLRLRHYSPRTQRSYMGWVKRFIHYLDAPHAKTPDSADAKAFLSFLATRRKVSASTQNQAFNALLFFYRHVLQTQLEDMSATVRARRGEKLPVVLSVDEVRAIFSQLTGKPRLMIELLYGSGLRLGELIRLRIKDIDFDADTITVRSGKGDKDRVTLMPQRLQPRLREQGWRHYQTRCAGSTPTQDGNGHGNSPFPQRS
jgi:hypothetical protein